MRRSIKFFDCCRYIIIKISRWLGHNIEINSREATKGVALSKLADYLEIPIGETMAFGDDLNDISMLEKAGVGVAMGNAYDEVKKAADYITDDCDRNGVASAVKHFLEID